MLTVPLFPKCPSYKPVWSFYPSSLLNSVKTTVFHRCFLISSDFVPDHSLSVSPILCVGVPSLQQVSAFEGACSCAASQFSENISSRLLPTKQLLLQQGLKLAANQCDVQGQCEVLWRRIFYWGNHVLLLSESSNHSLDFFTNFV